MLKGFQKATRRIKRFAQNTLRSAKRVAYAFTAMAVAAIFALKRILGAGEMFNRKMRRSLAIMTAVSGVMRADMKKTAIAVARQTMFSAEQAAEAYYYLASAGLDAAQSIAAMPKVAQFAQAGMFDMARATEMLTDAQSALGLKVHDAEQNMQNMVYVSDALVKAATLADATVEQLAESLATKAGSDMRFWKISLEDGLAVLLSFAEQGTKAADAGTAFHIMLRDFSSKAIENARKFKEFGIDVYEGATHELRPLLHIVADLEDALSNMGGELKKTKLLQLGFADRSVAQTTKLLGFSREMVRFSSALERAGGTSKRVADTQLTPLEKAVAKLGASWVNLSDKMTPVVHGEFRGHYSAKLVVVYLH